LAFEVGRSVRDIIIMNVVHKSKKSVEEINDKRYGEINSYTSEYIERWIKKKMS
jgi:hypothetical protein